MRGRIVFSMASASIYIYWLILLIGKGLGFSSADEIFRNMVFIAIPFVAIKLLISKWTKKDLIICISFNVLGILIWFFSKDADILLTTLTITACKDENLYNLLKLSFWVKGIMFVIVTSLAILGVTDMQLDPRYYSSSVFDVRYALGYGQPNTAQYTLFIIIVLAVLCYHKKMNIFHYSILLSYSIFIYQYTDSRTGIIMSVAFLLFTYYAERKSGFVLRSILKICGEYAYIIGAIISFTICFMFIKIPLLSSFGTLSSRFKTGTSTLLNNNISFFGIPNIETDFGYINILYGSGLIFFIVFLIGMTQLNKKFIKQNMYIETITLIIYAIYTLAESYSSSILMNVSLLFLTWAIFPKSKYAFECDDKINIIGGAYK